MFLKWIKSKLPQSGLSGGDDGWRYCDWHKKERLEYRQRLLTLAEQLSTEARPVKLRFNKGGYAELYHPDTNRIILKMWVVHDDGYRLIYIDCLVGEKAAPLLRDVIHHRIFPDVQLNLYPFS